ncbi:hypothetical protein PIB30_051356 [Stylosanthes scabra]|uniref:Uncharacterized protein n=1 Tax=Stylosanthes scabra TaxID=79078 RepID=A0ABU6YKB5_9FABA|nr:hypothetical protein [Stylosanthes scabra]
MLRLAPSSRRVREDNRRGIEKREKYEDSDEIADSDLGIIKTQRYHFDDEPFIHLLHNIRFDLDRPYGLPVESLLALKRRNSAEKKDPFPQGFGLSRRASSTPQYSPLGPDNKVMRGQDHSKVGNSFRHPRPMDMDADEDYLQYLEELQRHPEYSPVHSSHAFAQHPFDNSESPSSDAHSQPSYNLSSVWPPPIDLSQ